MIIYKDDKHNQVERTYTGKRGNRYRLTVAGWYGGTIRAATDTAALVIFKNILKEYE